MMEAAGLLGMSERQFRLYRGRFEEEEEDGLIDRRLGRVSPKRIERGEDRADAASLAARCSGTSRVYDGL
jgi:hypothetical protein